MRTTLTLEDDVAALLKRVMEKRKARLKEVVNEALREGLARLASPRRRAKLHRTTPVNAGRCLVANVDNVADVLAIAEGDNHR